MAPRIPLGPELRRSPFRVRDARAAGWGEGRLRGDDLARPFQGIRSVAGADPELAFAPLLLPGDRFSHLSAARLWGAPLPGDDSTVHVTRASASRHRGRGVVGHRSGAGRAVRRRDLPVSDPATLFLELATLLDVASLVAVGDHLVLDPRVLDPHDLRPYAALAELTRAVAKGRGRGIRTARAAFALVREEGVESPMETRLRLLVREAQLPEPLIGYELRDARGRVGFVDMAWPDLRLIVEYDGEQHRTNAAQYEKDAMRLERAAAAGWRTVRVRKHGILHDIAGTRRRLARALAEQRARHS